MSGQRPMQSIQGNERGTYSRARTSYVERQTGYGLKLLGKRYSLSYATYSLSSRDSHDVPGVLVNDSPVSQWLFKVKLNANSANHITSGRAGDGHRFDL